MHDSPKNQRPRQFPPIRISASLLAAAALLSTLAVGDQTTVPSTAESSDPGQLQPFNSLVGSWRGVGQPKRGSRRGAWQEKTVCRWDFTGPRPAIHFNTGEGKQFQRMTLSVDPKQNQLVLRQQADDQSVITYRGPVPEKWPSRIRLTTDAADDGSRYRFTIEQLSDIRVVMLFEQQASTSSGYRRRAGIGYTRSGHRLARSGGNQRECVVTGGRGTIAVMHKGQTWYVCCEGCRQAFEESPDEIIAAFLERQEQAEDR